MSILSREQRLRVLGALVDGNSERAVQRMTDVDRKTISRFALTLGAGAQHLHDRIARDLHISEIQCDEVWSFVRKKQARATPEESAAGLGEAYTFTSLGSSSRFVINWRVGKRDQATCDAFTADLRSRLLVMPAMTSDGFAPYINSIGASFGPGVAYAQTIKNYSKSGRRDDHRYEPPREPFITKKTVFGSPNLDRASTAYMERNNGTMRHHIGRMRRLCLAFSKSPAHHRAAVALCYAHYNLCWIVSTLRCTPAMAAGVTDHLWSLEEFLGAVLEAEPCEKPRAKPLEHIAPVGTSRALPGNRGFLRVLPGGNAPAPSPGPSSPPVAPAASSGAPAPVAGQLDLLSWRRPLPPVGTQMGLFGDLEPPEK